MHIQRKTIKTLEIKNKMNAIGNIFNIKAKTIYKNSIKNNKKKVR